MARTAEKNVIKRRSIEFMLEKPEARQVVLVGDFNQWNPQTHPMRRNGNGVWHQTVMLPPGRYEYRFRVDGDYYNDPNNTLRCSNCFGSENHVIEVLQ